MVQVADILDTLVAKSAAPSTFGAQLERLKYGIHVPQDPFRARDEVENNLLSQAAIYRCVDEFAHRKEFSVTTRQRKAADSGFKALTKVQEKTREKYPQGYIALVVLRAYHERSTASQERGLVEVYRRVAELAPDAVPGLPKGVEAEDMLQAFRANTAKRARNLACELYADALLALQGHVRVFNKREKQVAA